LRRISWSLGDKANISGLKLAKNDRCNLFYTLEEVAAKHPDKIYLFYQGREWTYLEYKLQAQRYANYFLSIGIKSKGVLVFCEED
jgi:non-ribosomal peptide synthetase component E (peptide arylation enzyme)